MDGNFWLLLDTIANFFFSFFVVSYRSNRNHAKFWQAHDCEWVFFVAFPWMVWAIQWILIKVNFHSKSKQSTTKCVRSQYFNVYHLLLYWNLLFLQHVTSLFFFSLSNFFYCFLVSTMLCAAPPTHFNIWRFSCRSNAFDRPFGRNVFSLDPTFYHVLFLLVWINKINCSLYPIVRYSNRKINVNSHRQAIR